MQRYAALLATSGVERGLLGPREPARLWQRHLLNSLAAAGPVDHGESVLDLGSGAGLPGLVWAIARPDLTVELVEPLLRRSEWLREVVDDLGLSGITVTRARAEELTTSRSVDVVTARAVAPLARLAGWALPLLRPGGVLLALKGEAAAAELTSARAALARLGAVSAEVLHPVVRAPDGSGTSVGTGEGPPAADRSDEVAAATVVRVVAGAGPPRSTSRGRAPGPPRSGRSRRTT